MIDASEGYIVNDYEWALTLEKTGLGEEEIGARCGAVIITRGEQGSTIRHGDHEIEIPAVRAEEVVDPTGCGDAYRAGLLFGCARGFGYEIAGRMGSLLGSLQVGSPGAQNLQVDPDAFRSRYEREFGSGF